MKKEKEYKSQKEFIDKFIEQSSSNLFTSKAIIEELNKKIYMVHIRKRVQYNKKETEAEYNKKQVNMLYLVNRYLSDKVKTKELTRIVNGIYSKESDMTKIDYVKFNDLYFGEGNWIYASKTLAKRYDLIDQVEKNSYIIISNKRLTQKATKELKDMGIVYKYATSLNKARNDQALDAIDYVDFEKDGELKILKKIFDNLEVDIEDIVFKYIMNNKDMSFKWKGIIKVLNYVDKPTEFKIR